MQELAAGARTPAQARDLDRGVFEPFTRRGRVFTPTASAFVKSGRLIAAVAAREGWDVLRENPSLANDALIAASCRERGVTLITRDRDFDRFRPLLGRWRHVAPWPGDRSG
jgi:predicted nucleic acid-binding protein